MSFNCPILNQNSVNACYKSLKLENLSFLLMKFSIHTSGPTFNTSVLSIY